MINVSSEKILIVDDEKQICTLIKSFLEKEQYSIFTAYDAESALDILNDITPDLIILDVKLPISRCRLMPADLQRLSADPISQLQIREIDKIKALSAGGTIYHEPFLSESLLQEWRRIWRRNGFCLLPQKGTNVPLLRSRRRPGSAYGFPGR